MSWVAGNWLCRLPRRLGGALLSRHTLRFPSCGLSVAVEVDLAASGSASVDKEDSITWFISGQPEGSSAEGQLPCALAEAREAHPQRAARVMPGHRTLGAR